MKKFAPILFAGILIIAAISSCGDTKESDQKAQQEAAQQGGDTSGAAALNRADQLLQMEADSTKEDSTKKAQ